MKLAYVLTTMMLALTAVEAVAQEVSQKSPGKLEPHIPQEKNLDPNWVESLFEKGQRKVYAGDELEHIGMPCGGIGAGQVEVTGEGTLRFYCSTFNKFQAPNAGHGLSTGYQYLNPQKPPSEIKNSFSITVRQQGQADRQYSLSGKDFDDIRFIGEYPVAQIEYGQKDKNLPVSIRSEVFSPFVPLDVRSSANPLTVVRFSVTNSDSKMVELSLTGALENIPFPEKEKVRQRQVEKRGKGVVGLLLDMQSVEESDAVVKHPQFGGVALSVLDERALVNMGASNPAAPAVGKLRSTFALQPGETKTCTFLVSWFFPNHHENGNRYTDAVKEAPGWVGRIYNNWYGDAFDVAEYVAENYEHLYSSTTLFRDTYHDTTLPYWLANRITMPVSTLACANVAIWENGRMYCYEGVGFCMGTCGHVYNFATAVSKLFPSLERSVRLMQDFKGEGKFCGYSKSGRINFRGYGVDKPEVPHSYASDAQSGYVLKAYREHLMSPDNAFLESIWDKLKGTIGYHIYKDSGEVGLEPNGVLEGEQTFWDPMWYGPNPYNNTLYLAALRAAEEMAKVMGEPELATRYRGIFDKGRAYMVEKMWNGEFYVHLYPAGFQGKVGIKNGFKLAMETEQNAIGFIEAFNRLKPNYLEGGACDAQQLFGQNWAHQLGLGYILPPDQCRTAAKSTFAYCWTPNIGTIYNVYRPHARQLAAPGEAAMVNAGWPHKTRQKFENTHDKWNVWTGLEYEAACDMITEGLIKEGLISIRSIHNRYNGAKRNPWSEVEGSDHYSRAMHSWNVLLALSGQTYDGPAGKIGFAPRITPEAFKCFFSSAEGWGSFEQKRQGNTQSNRLTIMWGRLESQTLSLQLASAKQVRWVEVEVAGKTPIRSRFSQEGGRLLISFDKPISLNAPQTLDIKLD
ncbi:hypothetical protein CA13_28860 [Planctomycetes bacterium CA13]|uniref:Glycosyl-hydrolase family 116 catalytic region domain-containing protein n=1 Tax=Novipirellula herctigrandis TaxID=2527986 RepID=A0A5C5Z4F8_9BACT|nr:hypothetical protein CA13_28860 [Planctomycetes bacterium CA13]